MESRPMATWVDEEGKGCTLLTGFTFVSTDSVSDELHQKYTFCGFIADNREPLLGTVEMQDLAAHMLLVCTFYNRPVGFPLNELRSFCVWLGYGIWVIEELARGGDLRKKSIAGKKFVFPTDKLFEKFRVPLRGA